MSGVIILNCRVCGAALETDEQQCSICMENNSKVQVLTREEKQHFNGVTLEQDQQEESGYYNYQEGNGNQQGHSKQFSISSTSLLTNLFIGLILAGVVAIALPLALLFISIIGIIAFIFRK